MVKDVSLHGDNFHSTSMPTRTDILVISIAVESNVFGKYVF